tara:strand:- start:9378 stop:10133 length:756 start_codon:yes stop_codon:yes gene_type:complete
MIEKVENILIVISRYFLIILGTLALIGAFLMLVYSLILIIDSPNTSPGKLPKISYNEAYKSSLFPKPKKTLADTKISNSINSSNNDSEKKPVDKRFQALHLAISKQFNDSQQNVNNFYNKITPRILEEYFNDNYSYLGLDYDGLIRGLTNFFIEISDINDFKRIGDFEDRYDLVLEVLPIYIDDYLENISIRENVINNNIADAMANNVKGYSNLIYVLYGLALYAAAVLYLMIFKVEINIRRIPTAIKDEN